MAKSRFDDWEDVKDCNQCEHYWNNTCDAPPEGSKLSCNSFLATRKVIIHEQIKTLQNSNKRLKIAVTVLCICYLILCVLVLSLFGG